MRRRKIRKMVREVVEAAHPELRKQLADEKEAVLQKERERVEAELATTRREAEEHWRNLKGVELKGLPEMSAWERSKLVTRRLAGIVFTLVDIPLGAWLWSSALVLDILAAFTVGGLVSVGVAVGTDFALRNFADDLERPLRSIRICRTTALVASLVVVAAAFVLFFMRSASPDMGPLVTLLILAVPGALWLASISLPILAGSLFSWAAFEERPWWYRKTMERLHRNIFDIDQALKKIDSLRGVRRPEGDGPKPPAGNGQMPPLAPVEERRKGVAPLAILLAAAFLAATPIDAAEIGSPNARQAVQQKSCEIWDDESSSVNQEDRAEALRRMDGLLADFVTIARCARLRVGHFTDEGPYAKFAEFDVPAPPSLDCTEAQSKYAKVFTLFKNVEEQKAERECSTRRQDANRKFETDRQAILANGRKILIKDKKANSPEKCTDIVRLLKARLNMVSDPTLILLFTDGVSDCQKEIQEIQVPPAARVIFLLLPTDRKIVSPDRVEDWMKMWATAIPGATMVPWVNLTPSWVRNLAQVPTAQARAVQNGQK